MDKKLNIPLVFWPQNYTNGLALPRIALPTKVLQYLDYCEENDIPVMLKPLMDDYHNNPNSVFRENRNIEVAFEKLEKMGKIDNGLKLKNLK